MKKILIVDDEEAILHTLSRAIRGKDLEVLTASTMVEAEYAINNSSLDLVLADIRLTGMLGREGLELLQYVKERSPETHVIIMTGYGSPEIEKEALDRGAAFYFEKPIDLKTLMQRLRELSLPVEC